MEQAELLKGPNSGDVKDGNLSVEIKASSAEGLKYTIHFLIRS